MLLPMSALYIANMRGTQNICSIIEFFKYTLTKLTTLYCKCELDTMHAYVALKSSLNIILPM